MSNNSTKEKVNQQTDKNVIRTEVFTELYTNNKYTNDKYHNDPAKVKKLYDDEKNRCLYFSDKKTTAITKIRLSKLLITKLFEGNRRMTNQQRGNLYIA